MKVDKKNDLKLRDYEKYWSVKVSFLMCSYMGCGYTDYLKKNYGKGFENAVFFVSNGYSDCYLKTAERESFGKYVIKKFAKNEKSIVDFCKVLKEKADYISTFMNEKEPTPSNLLEFSDLFAEYNGYHITPRHISDFLSEEKVAGFIPYLSEVRTYTEKIHPETDMFFGKYIKKISEKSGYDIDILWYLQKQEIEKYFKNGSLPSADKLEARKFSSIIYKNGKAVLTTGEEAKEFEKEINKTNISDSSEIKGNTAFGGKATGTVRIVFNPQNVSVFNKGDILVTPMTRPEFVPLMDKASAIVTDSGGLLCHAAIVARELKKPCIIGTKIATKVLKDGDIVEVDANNGIVKIIK